MAKLSRQEVSAVASKLHRELSKAAKEMRERAMEHYVPSAVYSKVQELLEKRNLLLKEQDRIANELEAIMDNANEACPFYIYNRDSKEKVLSRILSDECKLPAVPSVEELQDEVTIAAIGNNFNTASFIKEQLAKFKW